MSASHVVDQPEVDDVRVYRVELFIPDLAEDVPDCGLRRRGIADFAGPRQSLGRTGLVPLGDLGRRDLDRMEQALP